MIFKYHRKFAILTAILLIASFSNPQGFLNNSYATPVFQVPTQLDSNVPSGGSRVAVSGSNVFSTWLDQCSDVWYARSTDNGDTFPPNPVRISGDPSCSFSTYNGRVAASGSNVYVAWVDPVAPGIFIQSSTNDGQSFNGVDFTDPLFPGSATSVSPNTPPSLEISATGDYLYLVWVDVTNNVQLAASNDNGASFDIITLGTAGASAIPVVASSGDDAFVAWQDSSDDIIVKKITYDFGLPGFDDSTPSQNLSDTTTATLPRIAVAGTNVYVAWQDAESGPTSEEIYFSKSTDGGATFNGGIPGTPGVPVNLSGNTGRSVQPDIAATGDNVFVVWRDNQFLSSTNYEILLQSSSDKGDTFNDASHGLPVDISGNSGNSDSPKISASGSEAYVVWQDDDSGDILFRTILNNGNTIGGIKNISTSPDQSILPQVASSSTNVSVIWDDFPQVNVSFNHAIQNDMDMSLDQTEYLQGDTATITVIAPTGTGPIPVDVFSSSDPGFSINANEIVGSPGVYTAEITFTTGSSDGISILHAIAGNQIFVTEPLSGQTTFASIVGSGDISFTPVTTAYDRGAIAHVTVTDALANTKPLEVESITVDVTSTTQVGSTPLTLQETGPDTGIFGNNANNKLIFITSSDSLWPENSQITITQEHLGADITSGPDTISEIILSTSDPAGITLTLTETGDSTGIFTGVLTLSNTGSVPGSTIKAPPGDIVQVIRGAAISNALVTPSTNNVATVLVNADPLTDTVTVSHGGSSVLADVEKQFASGGGGGGISRAGFVVNALGFVKTSSANGRDSSGTGSAFGKSSFAIISGGDQGFGGILDLFSANTFDQTKTFKVGEKAVIRFDFTERGGIGKIEHIGLFANIRDAQKKYDSDTFIIYNPIKSQQATIHDPNGLFSEATFELLQKDSTNFVLKYDLTFAKPMAKSDLLLESWNSQKQLSTNKIANAIEVVSSGIVQEQTTPAKTTFTEDITNDKVIPVWVKSNAKWWADGKLDNQNFISGLEYLVNEGIIKVSSTNTSDSPTNPSDSPTITEIQPWIKSTAGWWADDKISENEFVTAIQWLITNNIIQVAA